MAVLPGGMAFTSSRFRLSSSDWWQFWESPIQTFSLQRAINIPGSRQLKFRQSLLSYWQLLPCTCLIRSRSFPLSSCLARSLVGGDICRCVCFLIILCWPRSRLELSGESGIIRLISGAIISWAPNFGFYWFFPSHRNAIYYFRMAANAQAAVSGYLASPMPPPTPSGQTLTRHYSLRRRFYPFSISSLFGWIPWELYVSGLCWPDNSPPHWNDKGKTLI